MRSRPLAAAAAFALAFTLASCGGGDDEPQAKAPTTAQSTPDASTATTTGSTPAPSSTPAKSGDSGKKGEEKLSEAEKEFQREGPKATPSAKRLPDVAAASADLTNFSTALGAADLKSTLAQNGPYTVFAPNNDGFAKLGTRLDSLLQPASKAELVNILSYHVVSGKFLASDLRDGKLLTTLQGTRLRLDKKDGVTSVGNSNGDARIVATNLVGGNGVIHIIDTVLTPKT